MTKPINFGAPKPAPIIDVELTEIHTSVVNPVVMPAAVPTVIEQKTYSPPAVIMTDDEIDTLGADAINKTSGINRKILAGVKATDTDAFGAKLNELVVTAKGLDPKKMQKGWFSKMTGLGGNLKEKLLSQYEDVSKRMGTLAGEMDKSADLMKARVGDLEAMFEDNYQQHQELEKVVEVNTGNLELMRQQLAAEAQATDAFAAQRKADMQDRIDRLEKRIDDLKRVMQLAKLAAPEIRMMQSHNRNLVSNFKTIKTTTLPAWEGVFSRYIIGLETKKATELQTAVMDATDEAFRMQADQLRQNAVAVAQAQQRSVVSIETLEHMQEQLIGAVDDVLRIKQEGAAARAAALPKLQSLEDELIKRFSPPQLTNGS